MYKRQVLGQAAPAGCAPLDRERLDLARQYVGHLAEHPGLRERIGCVIAEGHDRRLPEQRRVALDLDADLCRAADDHRDQRVGTRQIRLAGLDHIQLERQHHREGRRSRLADDGADVGDVLEQSRHRSVTLRDEPPQILQQDGGHHRARDHFRVEAGHPLGWNLVLVREFDEGGRTEARQVAHERRRSDRTEVATDEHDGRRCVRRVRERECATRRRGDGTVGREDAAEELAKRLIAINDHRAGPLIDGHGDAAGCALRPRT